MSLPKPYYDDSQITMHLGDCREVLAAMPDNSVDSVVTDPPYELGFMGRSWDASGIAYDVALWREVYRVLKPGGYLLSFGGSRTYHRMAVAIEDAGFVLHPMLGWVFGSGFPKATNLGKRFDAEAGAERETWEVPRNGGPGGKSDKIGQISADRKSGIGIESAPATPEAQQWDGWYYGRQSLKPSLEPVCMAQKPPEGRMTDNVRQWGTGAVNVDACRVGTTESLNGGAYSDNRQWSTNEVYGEYRRLSPAEYEQPDGRWPPNLILDDHAAQMLDAEVGELSSGSRQEGVRNGMGYHGANGDGGPAIESSTGGPSRFFPVIEPDMPIHYCAKASTAERNAGIPQGREQTTDDGRKKSIDNPYLRGETLRRNSHPTVKPIALMRWLVRLVTPPGGTVLDPFYGSGTTGCAARLEGFKTIGIEQHEPYLEIAVARLAQRVLPLEMVAD